MGLYGLSAKCETPHKFTGGYLKYYSKQVENEDIACKFIESLKSGTYDNSGNVNFGSNSHKSAISKTTGGQKFFLVLFMFSTTFLGWYGAMLRKRVISDATLQAATSAHAA